MKRKNKMKRLETLGGLTQEQQRQLEELILEVEVEALRQGKVQALNVFKNVVRTASGLVGVATIASLSSLLVFIYGLENGSGSPEEFVLAIIVYVFVVLISLMGFVVFASLDDFIVKSFEHRT